MNPCRQYKKPIALAAAGCLEDQALATLRLHLPGCASCRDYAAALGAVAREHTERAGIEGSLDDSVETRLMTGLEAAQSAGQRSSYHPLLALTQWKSWPRWSLAGAVAVLLAMGWMVWSRTPHPSFSPPVALRPLPSFPGSKVNDQPSWLAYRLAVNRSWEDLDNLLTRQEPGLLRDQETINRQAWLTSP